MVTQPRGCLHDVRVCVMHHSTELVVGHRSPGLFADDPDCHTSLAGVIAGGSLGQVAWLAAGPRRRCARGAVSSNVDVARTAADDATTTHTPKWAIATPAVAAPTALPTSCCDSRSPKTRQVDAGCT